MLALFSMPYGSDAYSCFIFQIRFKLQHRKLEAGTHRNNSCFYCISIHTSTHTLSSGKLLWNVEHTLIFMADFEYFHSLWLLWIFFVFKLSSSAFHLSLDIVIFAKLIHASQSWRTLWLWPNPHLRTVGEKTLTSLDSLDGQPPETEVFRVFPYYVLLITRRNNLLWASSATKKKIQRIKKANGSYHLLKYSLPALLTVVQLFVSWNDTSQTCLCPGINWRSR